MKWRSTSRMSLGCFTKHPVGLLPHVPPVRPTWRSIPRIWTCFPGMTPFPTESRTTRRRKPPIRIPRTGWVWMISTFGTPVRHACCLPIARTGCPWVHQVHLPVWSHSRRIITWETTTALVTTRVIVARTQAHMPWNSWPKPVTQFRPWPHRRPPNLPHTAWPGLTRPPWWECRLPQPRVDPTREVHSCEWLPEEADQFHVSFPWPQCNSRVHHQTTRILLLPLWSRARGWGPRRSHQRKIPRNAPTNAISPTVTKFTRKVRIWKLIREPTQVRHKKSQGIYFSSSFFPFIWYHGFNIGLGHVLGI